MNHSAITLYLFIILSIVRTQPVHAAEMEIQWQQIGTGISLTRVRVHPNSLLSPEILLVDISLAEFRVATVRSIDFGSQSNTVKKLSKASKALIGINANFFDEKNKPLGLVMSNGIVQQQMHNGGKTLTGIFQISRNGAAVVSRPNFTYDKVTEAIQAGPRLINNGVPVVGQRESHTRSRRAGVCVQSPDSIIFYISSGIIGVSISEVQQVLMQPGVRCLQALNLDGGGSAQLFVSNTIPGAIADLEEITIHGSDSVPIILGIFPRR